MAKRDTDAHKSHTEEAELAEAVRKMQDLAEFHNGTPERAFDEFEALATPPDSQAKKHLIFTVWLVRHCIEDGDALYASYYAMRAGVLAHGLGWSEENADRGRKSGVGRAKSLKIRREKKPDYQGVLDKVRGQRKGVSKTEAREKAAEICGRDPRTIARNTDWN